MAVAHGLGNAQQVIDRDQARARSRVPLRRGDDLPRRLHRRRRPAALHRPTRSAEARIAAIYREDEGKKLRKSHENPDVAQLYEEFLGSPLGEKSHHLLHTRYAEKERV